MFNPSNVQRHKKKKDSNIFIYYNRSRHHKNGNSKFNLDIFKLFARIYERLTFIKKKIFKNNLISSAQNPSHERISNILKIMERDLFQVDIKCNDFVVNPFLHKTNFLYL